VEAALAIRHDRIKVLADMTEDINRAKTMGSLASLAKF
jgi:hypothetical protein